MRLARHLAPLVLAAVICGLLARDMGARGDDVRGLWVSRSTLTSAASIARMVEAAYGAGFNTLLVQVRGRGEAFYRSDLEPRASELAGSPADFDPLATTLQLARRRGLRVHAWFNVNLVASATTLPRSRAHVVLRHPAWLMVPREIAGTLSKIDLASPAYVATLARWTRQADDVEGLYLSPVLSESRAYTTAVVRELAQRYDLDGVHFDYVRYPGPRYDESPAALAEFRVEQMPLVAPAERVRLDREARTDVSAWARSAPHAWEDFLRRRLTALVIDMRSAIRAARPSATVSAALIPDADAARRERFQDWAAWAGDGTLDVVCPMIYTTDAAEFAATVADLRRTLGAVPMWAGIGAYRLPVSRTAENVRAARRSGAAGILLFSYDSLVAPTAPARGYLAAMRPVLLEAGPASDRR